MKNMDNQWKNSYLFGSNADFIEELYAQYLENNLSVDQKWQKYFNSIQDSSRIDIDSNKLKHKFTMLTQNPAIHFANSDISDKQVQVWQLINMYKFLGVNYANLDPLQRRDLSNKKDLLLSNFGLENDLETEFYYDQNNTELKIKLKDIVAKLNNTYCGSVGFEYKHISNLDEQKWLEDYIETKYLQYTLNKEDKLQILQKLVEAEGWEKFIHVKYVGQKRFSLEGGDSLIPALDRLINQAIKNGVNDIVVGMAHRGRLNALVNIAGKSPQKIIDEFDGNYPQYDFVTSGDVKYHKGHSCNYITPNGVAKVTIPFNPSHLEVINPVANGMVRAKQDKSENKKSALGVLIHGDSALIGLGTNQGTFNMSQTNAYGVDGMIHIAVNNQVGFTTSDIRDNRSSRFSTDIAKMIEAPIIHVNADDVEKVAFVIDLAIEYRTKFAKDIMIDLVCFRRHGHNESDDPTLTQPYMYRKIKAHVGTKTIYANKLIAENLITADDLNNITNQYKDSLSNGMHPAKEKMVALKLYEFDPSNILNANFDEQISTSITNQLIETIGNNLHQLPYPEFKLHPTIAKLFETRKQMINGQQPIDYGMAEILAYASLLQEGINVRITGEDTGRGTFSHRHAIIHDFNREDIDDNGYVPLTKLENNSKISIHDSVLNEECVLGFEYGYSTQNLNDFVMWEAQFGDFANGAQVMIDQFITSGEAKWGVLNRLTMMLPHGFDGQGPEHSSARLERYLQLCAENNIQVVNPSNAAQMFHVIRRQAKTDYIKPLVIMLSKRMIRNKDAANNIDEFINGGFKLIIGDDCNAKDSIDKIIVCSGQIYYDAIKYRNNNNLKDKVAIIRIEQLYPFPINLLKEELTKYHKATKFIWLQEEPYNQGGWIQIRESLDYCLNGYKFNVASRPSAAAPACGTIAMHNNQLNELLIDAFK